MAKSEPHIVYFAGCGDHVKIGITRALYARIKTLNTSSPFPVTLLAAMTGGAREEEMLHGRFRRLGLLVKGEWFRREGPLAELVERMAGYDEDAARGIADEWWRDTYGVGPNSLGNTRWTFYSRAAIAAGAPLTG